MWLLAPNSGSLLSVVKFDPKKVGAGAMAKRHGATVEGVDYMLVRARIEASLKYVADTLAELYKNGPNPKWQKPIVEAQPTADYKYRMIVSRGEWKEFVAHEIDEISYDSHIKEETVKRQPLPKVANLYSALSATWSAWAKLQDSPPYGGSLGYSYSTVKPDCKNCGHPELKHAWKGDSCNFGKVWKGGKYVAEEGKELCDCSKYEPKPAPKPPALPAGTGKPVAVGESAPDPKWTGTYKVTKPSVVDAEVVEGDALENADGIHQDWCTFHDGDPCICVEPTDEELWAWENEYPGLFAAMEAGDVPGNVTLAGKIVNGVLEYEDADGNLYIDAKLVEQEEEPAGETPKDRKARNQRNKRRRKHARQQARAVRELAN